MKLRWGAVSLLLMTFGTLVPGTLLAEERPASPGRDDDLSSVRLLALAPLEGKATLRMPRGDLLLVAPGDLVGEPGAVVVEVLEDRLVLADPSADEPGWIWLYKPKRPGEPSRLQRVSRRNPEPLETSLPPAWIAAPKHRSGGPEDAEEPSAREEEGQGGGGRDER